jgi:putative transposase
MICEWYNKDIIQLQKNIPFPEKYKKTKVSDNYKNVLEDVKTCKSKHLFNIEKYNEVNNLELTYKYKIKFNEEQHTILKLYFNECNIIYNLCVDIWKEYKNITDNWMILKDAIYDIYYRDKNTIKESKKLIIERLKKNNDEYNLENKQNKEKIDKLKSIEKEKYKKELENYNKIKKENIIATIKKIIKKPSKNVLKIEKIKNPPKPRRGNVKKPAPDETLKGEIKTFCSNLKSARTNNSNDNDSYELKHKDINKKQTIIVGSRNINSNGIFSQKLKELKRYNYKKIYKKHNIEKECKLMHNKIFDSYYLYIIEDKEQINIKNRKEIVAIDEGEKIFASYYSVNEIGNLGKDMRIKILGIQSTIKQYQKKLKNKKYKNRKKQIKQRIARCFKKIKGYVNEIHKKSAKYLCENYENIFLPTFETKPMISKNKIKLETERIKKINNKEEAKIEIRKLGKIIRLSGKVKFVLSMQSHYRFKEYLKAKAKAKRYRTNVYDVNESYTSQMCTKCGLLSKEYDKKRVKQCSCGYKVDRDVNGSRNILLKCIKELTLSVKA